MKHTIEIDDELVDALLVRSLKENYKDAYTISETFTHPADIEYNKRLAEALAVVLDFYGVDVNE